MRRSNHFDSSNERISKTCTGLRGECGTDLGTLMQEDRRECGWGGGERERGVARKAQGRRLKRRERKMGWREGTKEARKRVKEGGKGRGKEGPEGR